ncbi:CDP-glucose 4,6-dehydratase [Caulobacter endophyticus]|uniref:CDP-glucose 4,6-dehydratase n=1 Tax=Caulobacter endophyticus TaxID=2172652 RepID=UPI00240F2F43|nr:CDP-glucose 4,6-dehydratase [Caulobacter endophyticus]MDG2528800.1 CDP-glucose 4,6-dehydratase [Caulobacter endophyticus]
MSSMFPAPQGGGQAGGRGAPDADFWSKQRVFLTGHTGFKGGWLALWLAQMGATVRGYALPASTEPSLFEAARVASVVESVIGDIRDADHLAREIEAFRPTVLIHMAAQALVRPSYDDPITTYSSNVMGTVHVLEAARRCDTLGSTVVVTSDKCYENQEVIWAYRETDRLNGHDPYSNSKACSELVAYAYGRSFFHKLPEHALVSVRAGNVIGGGDWSRDRLLPDLMEAFADGREAIIRRPGSVRPWQHVLEPLSGYLVAAQASFGHGSSENLAWNFGPRESSNRPVSVVATLARDLWGDQAKLTIQEDPNAVHEAGLLTLDSTKAAIELGWAPRWSLQEAVGSTVAWRKAFGEKADMQAVTYRQIQDYVAAGAVIGAY